MLSLLRRSVHIELSPKLVVFRCGRRAFRTFPLGYMTEEEPPQLLSVGEYPPAEAPPTTAVRVLVPEPQHLFATPAQCLQAFLRFGAIRVAGLDVYRPFVFHGCDSLRELFGGGERAALADAALACGARRYRFAG